MDAVNTQSELHHYQEWVLNITPASGDPWPTVSVPSSTYRDAFRFQPVSLTLHARGGDTCTGGHLTGLQLRADGSVGKRRGGTRQLPLWAAELLEREMKAHNLTREYLASQGVDVRF